MDEWEQQWIVHGMAWVALRHWRGGRAAGDAARAWFWARLDARRCGRHITPELERLEAALYARLCGGGDQPELTTP